MTEKEVLRELGAYVVIQDSGYINLCLRAIEISKEHGAKYDREIVELPPLMVSGTSFGTKESYTCGICTKPTTNYPYGRLLNKMEIEEVIRRCELVPKLRDVILDIHYTNEDILAILDGRKEIK